MTATENDRSGEPVKPRDLVGMSFAHSLSGGAEVILDGYPRGPQFPLVDGATLI